MVNLNTLVKTHYIRNNLIALFFGVIVPAFLLTSSRSNACGAYLLTALIALIPTNIAYSKGMNFAKWFIYSTFLWIIAIIHSIKITPNDKSRIRAGYHKCPYCGELSRPEATVCHCCGRDLFI